jgi:formate hydrogenlyase transcriptional activator
MLPNSETEPAELAVAAAASVSDNRPGGSDLTSLAEVERRHILGILEKSGWVIEGPNGAAKSLELDANTLRSKMKKLGIRRPNRRIAQASF